MPAHFTGPVLHKEMPGDEGNARAWYSKLPVAHDPDYVVYFNDFINSADYAATDWTITTTEAGGGDATEALGADALNGTLVITNDAADDDLDSLQLNEEVWALAAGKRLWFETRVKIADADTEDGFIGLCITDTTPLVATDRVGFDVVTTNASIRALTEKDSTETNTDTTKDFADDTFVKLGFYWDGVSRVRFYVDRTLVATHTANVPDNENLAVTVHHQNGDAVADAMTIDYILVVMER